MDVKELAHVVVDTGTSEVCRVKCGPAGWGPRAGLSLPPGLRPSPGRTPSPWEAPVSSAKAFCRWGKFYHLVEGTLR